MGQQKRTTAPKTAKRKTGRPANTLTERSQLRHAPGEWEEWTALGQSLGFAGASAFLRKLGNDAVAKAKNGSPT